MQQTATAAVDADGVAKAYGETTALDGVSLSVAPGEVFALVGPNGAGKTTLVGCLTGTTVPDSGAITLLGESPQDASRERVGLLPQSFRPPERLTPRELVAYYAGLYDEARDAADLLEEVGVDPDLDTWYADLSGGEQRRVCVAAALANDPEVLFVDEPTTGVDPAGRRALWDLFEALADEGTAVFLTTHDMAEATRLADRVGLLSDGRLVAEGTPASLVADHGGESALTVETGAGTEAFADSDFSPTASEDGLVFEGVAPEEIASVVAAFEERGVEFAALSWSEPDLEDAYLSLTGRAIERGGEAREREVAQ